MKVILYSQYINFINYGLYITIKGNKIYDTLSSVFYNFYKAYPFKGLVVPLVLRVLKRIM